MPDLIVLGGYGRVGSLCVLDLLETTRARIVVAGRNAQLSDEAALAYGERASSAYINATDSRTLQEELEGAAAILCCSAGPPLAALERALELRVPFVSITSFFLDAHTRAQLSERAWEAGVPLVLDAGAVPGLPGVVAETLMRRFDTLHELRIACTGPFRETESARRDLEALRVKWKPAPLRPRVGPGAPSRWPFPEPIGRRIVWPSASLDLEGFAASHCVEQLTYLEPDAGRVARGVDRLLQRGRPADFALVGEAFPSPTAREPAGRLSLHGRDTPGTAAAAAGALVRGVLAGKVPPGLLRPREALNPGLFLDALARRGIRVWED